MNPNRIIIVEDEKSISDGLVILLESNGLSATVFATGLGGLSHYTNHDLMILDLKLPDIYGLEVLKRIRQESPYFPVIIVSAQNSEEDLIEGLTLGADDYVTKPFSTKELLLRIKRTLERKTIYDEKRINTPSSIFKFGKVNEINFDILQAKNKNETITLTQQEVNILQYLIENSGKIVNRNTLINHIWGHNQNYESRTIDNFIVRFRKYFEVDPKKPKHFLTKRGIGYIFNP